MTLVALLLFVVAILILLIVICGGHNPTKEEEPAGDVLADASRLKELERRVLELERQLRDQRGVPERVEAVEANCSDVEGAVAGALREDVERLRSEKASAADVAALSQEVSRLKEAEARRARSESAAAKVPAEDSPRQQDQTPGRVTAALDPYLDRLLDGIIAHLTRGCGGNVHKKGVVTVTASSVWSGEPENVVDLTSDSVFFTKDWPNSWIRYDFRERRVTPTSYSIFSTRSWKCSQPKSWVLEVSNDGSEGSWAVVDARENNEDLNDRHVIRNFSLGTPLSGAFRFVRLRLTGKNHEGHDSLKICALELFGTLSE